MKILALSTSSDMASVAVAEDSIILHQEALRYKRLHSQILVPMIDHVLNWLDMKVRDIDVFAVDIGPGSFTGLRIGCATVKALAHVTDKPIVGIISLDALAEALAFSPYSIFPLVDAQQNSVYTACYTWHDNNTVRKSNYAVLSLSELEEKVKHEKAIVFTGPAVSVYKHKLINIAKTNIFFAPEQRIMPMASDIASLALKRVIAGEIDDYMSLQPFYMRKSSAEVKAGV